MHYSARTASLPPLRGLGIGRAVRRLAVWLACLLLVSAAQAQKEPTSAPAAPLQAPARPLLWMVDRPTPAFVFGTIHLPDERVLRFGQEVRVALDAADELYTEAPLDLNAIMSASKGMMLPEGESLADVLPKAVYERLERRLQSRGHMIEGFSRMSIWVVATQLEMLDYLKFAATRQPLDLQLYSEAASQGKTVGGLETFDEQLAIFTGLSQEQQVELLTLTLDDLDEAEREGRDPTQTLIEFYLRGDEKALAAYMNEHFDPTRPLERELYERVLLKRNRVMTERIDAKLKAGPDQCLFFAIGAAHLPEDDGVLHGLQKAGYQLRRVESSDLARIRGLKTGLRRP